MRFIEVKGRVAGATSVTITKNEILTALNKPDDYILALVEVPPSDTYQGPIRGRSASMNGLTVISITAARSCM